MIKELLVLLMRAVIARTLTVSWNEEYVGEMMNQLVRQQLLSKCHLILLTPALHSSGASSLVR